MDNIRPDLLNRLLYPTRRFKAVLSMLIVALFVVVWAFVYVTGGTRFGYLHVMYIPIIMSAMVFGHKGGIVTGLVAGIILGPMMPLNTETMENQSLYSWMLRMFFFILSGGFVGYTLNTVRRKNAELTEVYTHDPTTGIETMNAYWHHHDKDEIQKDRVAVSLHINNFDSLVVLLGMGEYSALLKNIRERIIGFFGEDTGVYLRDRRLFWIDTSKARFNAIRDNLAVMLEKDIIYSETVPLFLDFSIGVSIPETPKAANERFKESEIAALHAKDTKQNILRFHEDFRKDKLLLERLSDLPRALEDNEFFLVYQPIIDLNTDTVSGVEALIRWGRDGDTLTPDQFIQIAEETKIIDHITEWVLDAALDAHEVFRKRHETIEIAINVSYRNLFNKPLIERMVERIRKSGLDPDTLHIEMTESTLMRNRTSTQAFLSSFRKLGVSTILDDFGTGYSSLSCLRDLPVDSVKIDREFTMNIHEDESMHAMIETIIGLAHKMKLKVIAEGVEEKAILDELRRLGCDYVQGYYFSRPLAEGDVSPFIDKYNS